MLKNRPVRGTQIQPLVWELRFPTHACSVIAVLSNSVRPYGLSSARLFCLWHSPRKNTGVACHFLLQAICPTQGSNPRLSCPPALAGRFFTTSATWEAQDATIPGAISHVLQQQKPPQPEACTSQSEKACALRWWPSTARNNNYNNHTKFKKLLKNLINFFFKKQKCPVHKLPLTVPPD